MKSFKFFFKQVFHYQIYENEKIKDSQLEIEVNSKLKVGGKDGFCSTPHNIHISVHFMCLQ